MVGGSKIGSAADYLIDSAHPPQEVDKQMPSAILLYVPPDIEPE
jgi:hypothetical protein